MKQSNKAYIYVSLAILFWGTSASAFKIGLLYCDYFQLLLYSSITALIVLFLVIIIQRKIKLLFLIKFIDIKKSFLLGFLSPFLYYIILFKAYSLLQAQIAQTLNYIWPITLVLLSIPILKQKLAFKSIIALIISFIGVIFISSKGKLFDYSITEPLGIFLALGSSILWALYWLYNMKDKIDQVVRLFYNFLFASIFIFITTFIYSSVNININGLISSVYIGMFEMAFTYILWLKALRLSRTTAKISNLIFLTPFVSLIFIHFILHESIYYTTIIGLVLIIIGIVIEQTNNIFSN